LHGGHHGAQQSTSTGRPVVCSTSRSKLWSVISIGFESCSPAEPASFSPHRPHFASLFASLLSSIRFFAPQWLQTTTCIQHLPMLQFDQSPVMARHGRAERRKGASTFTRQGSSDFGVFRRVAVRSSSFSNPHSTSLNLKLSRCTSSRI